MRGRRRKFLMPDTSYSPFSRTSPGAEYETYGRESYITILSDREIIFLRRLLYSLQVSVK